MIAKTKSWVCITFAVAVAFVALTPCANAQEQALGLTLLKTSIRTEVDTIDLITNEFQPAFPPTKETCPTTATKGCTLRIEVSCIFVDTWASGSETINVTVTGAGLPSVDPAAAIPIDGAVTQNDQWDAHTFHWMQRSVPAGATVTVNIGVEGAGSAGDRAETVELLKN